MFRRRRRGLTVLPSYAGGSYFSSGTQTGAHSNRISQNQNQNQGPYAAYPMSNQQAWGGYQPPPGPPQFGYPPPGHDQQPQGMATWGGPGVQQGGHYARR